MMEKVLLMLYPRAYWMPADPHNDFELDGEKIIKWNVSKLGPQPDEKFLAAKAIELAPQIALMECLDKRRAAYQAESDPLLPEALYDRFVRSDMVKWGLWADKVSEIKTRYPLEEK